MVSDYFLAEDIIQLWPVHGLGGRMTLHDAGKLIFDGEW